MIQTVAPPTTVMVASVTTKGVIPNAATAVPLKRPISPAIAIMVARPGATPPQRMT